MMLGLGTMPEYKDYDLTYKGPKYVLIICEARDFGSHFYSVKDCLWG